MNKPLIILGAVIISAVLALSFAPGAAITQLVSTSEVEGQKVTEQSVGTPGLGEDYFCDRAVGSSFDHGSATIHRLYNPNSGEHFYTGSADERNRLIVAGWNYEGIGWYAPESSSVPVFRLYNPNTGDHHYTTEIIERDHIAELGWIYEGIGWYSSEPDTVPLFRVYNPNAQMAGSHHFTSNGVEKDYLVSVGWNDEGIGWYALEGAKDEEIRAAVYLGVQGYGLEETNKDNKDDFLYRFQVDGGEVTYRLSNGIRDEYGNYDYPIQNILKEGYRYIITIENGIITAAEEIKTGDDKYIPVVSGVPGEHTIKNFLKTGLMPVGTTLYIYGGGWDWQDEGSSIQARTIGVSPDWVRFFEDNDASYTYKAAGDPSVSYFPYGGYNEYYYAGLDCSGYLGWTLYNTMETESGKEGYVGSSTKCARRLSELGLGEWTQDIGMPDTSNYYQMKPGDIMSINGHVWISLGTCEDGSVVILHSTPSYSRIGQPGGGVQINAIGYSKGCEAYALADRYMSQYYPKWYERYQVYLCSPYTYFTFEGENAGRFSWDTQNSEAGLKDPDGIREKTPEEVLALLFGE